jgi:CelD/BcsL family acetyltransferase involved in cellulose biosynthesis
MSTPHVPEYETVLADPTEAGVWADWSVLRSGSPFSSPFANPDLMRGLEKASRRDLRLALVYADGRPCLGIPLYADRRLGILRAGMPPFVPYAPLLRSGEWSAWATHQRRDPVALLAGKLGGAFGAAALHLQPEWVDVRPFVWQGWSARPFYTYLAPLDDPEGPLARWAKNNRRDFRFYAADYAVREDIGDRDRVVSLVESSYARHERPLPIPPERLSALLGSILPSEFARIFLATDRIGRPVAGLVLLVDRDRATYWLSGSQPGPAMTVLIGTVFEWLAAEGMRTIDFVGANTPSIAEFKRRFGSQLIPYYRVEFFSGALTRWLNTVRPIV